MCAAWYPPRLIESGGVFEFKCLDRTEMLHDLLGLFRVGRQPPLGGAGHHSLLFFNFPCRVASGNEQAFDDATFAITKSQTFSNVGVAMSNVLY